MTAGETWITKTLPAGGTSWILDGVVVKVPQEPQITVEAYDPDEPVGRENGSMLLFVKPPITKGTTTIPNPRWTATVPASLPPLPLREPSTRTCVSVWMRMPLPIPTDTVQFSYSTDKRQYLADGDGDHPCRRRQDPLQRPRRLSGRYARRDGNPDGRAAVCGASPACQSGPGNS